VYCCPARDSCNKIIIIIIQYLTIATILCAGDRATLHFNLVNYSTKAEVLAAVDRIQYHRERTNMTGGLKLARVIVFDRYAELRRHADRIIVLIAAGVPTVDTHILNDEVAMIKRRRIRIVGLGITNRVRQFCLIAIPFGCSWRWSVDVNSN